MTAIVTQTKTHALCARRSNVQQIGGAIVARAAPWVHATAVTAIADVEEDVFVFGRVRELWEDCCARC
jgi:hypothetical protein